jgi:hypothetical protein
VNDYEAVAIVLAAIAFVTGLGLFVERLRGGDPDLGPEPWDPHPQGFGRCGRRGCPNPHPAQPWVEDRHR